MTLFFSMDENFIRNIFILVQTPLNTFLLWTIVLGCNNKGSSDYFFLITFIFSQSWTILFETGKYSFTVGDAFWPWYILNTLDSAPCPALFRNTATMIFSETVSRPIHSIGCNICLWLVVFVCSSPFARTWKRVDWWLLVRNYITNFFKHIYLKFDSF